MAAVFASVAGLTTCLALVRRLRRRTGRAETVAVTADARRCKIGRPQRADGFRLPRHVRAFHTIAGHNLLQELRAVCVPGRTLIVTMRDLWDVLALHKVFDESWSPRVHFVDSLETVQLDRASASIAAQQRQQGAGGVRVVVGIGGGQAIDVAKYFAWTLDGSPLLFQMPTALTVDAAWGHRAAVRVKGVVRYVGFAVPQAVYVDYDVVRRAPRRLNMSGVGDVLCYHTAHADWALAEAAGASAPWPYDAGVVAEAAGVVQYLVAHLDEVRALSNKGIDALVTALSYGGAAFHAHGWNPRPVEGFDHIFFYALEKRTGKHFIHGYPVLLGVYLGSLLQDNRAAWVLSVIVAMDIDIRPDAMGVTWHDVRGTLLNLADFASSNGFMYTVANHRAITDEWVDAARANIAAAYAGKAAARRPA